MSQLQNLVPVAAHTCITFVFLVARRLHLMSADSPLACTINVLGRPRPRCLSGRQSLLADVRKDILGCIQRALCSRRQILWQDRAAKRPGVNGWSGRSPVFIHSSAGYKDEANVESNNDCRPFRERRAAKWATLSAHAALTQSARHSAIEARLFYEPTIEGLHSFLTHPVKIKIELSYQHWHDLRNLHQADVLANTCPRACSKLLTTISAFT